MTIVVTTQRLSLREATLDDGAFFLTLLNQKGWIEFIGDRNVHDVAAAKDYIRDRIISQYRDHGFGLWVMEMKENGKSVGICGLVKRQNLEDPDLGYALLDAYQGRGLVHEAALGVIGNAFNRLGLPRLAGITDPQNERSRNVLEKLGFAYQGVKHYEDGPDSSFYMLHSST